ncbi:methyl-accepting chemotaxis protein [Fulvimarina sp. MAC8]|uniref:methyl-accepting chemotaxis protein n=1 Tax=Fulvimarina sp. MAC8 TaxID=3162874 RepID=UPI0032EEDF8B
MSASSHSTARTRSLSWKAAIVTAVPVLVGIAALVALELQGMKSSLFDQAEGSTKIVVSQMAEQMAGGVKWAKAEVVEKVYADLAQDPTTGLSDVLVLDREGNALTTFSSETLPSLGDLGAFAENVDGLETEWKSNHFIAATPIGETEKPVGTLVTSWEVSHLQATANEKIVRGSLFGVVIAAFIVAIVVFFLKRSVTGPIRETTQVMSALAAGDRDVNIPHLGRRDEIGAMAAAVETFKAQAVERDRLASEADAARASQEEAKQRQSALDNAKAEDLRTFVGSVEVGFDRLSAGDLTVRMNEEIAPEFEPIRAKFNASVEALEGVVASVVRGTGSIRTGLSEISTASLDLSQRTEQQAASIEETVAALSDVSRGVNETAEGAQRAQTVAGAAREKAEEGGAIVRDAIGAMSDIERSSNEINAIISVIDEMAFQTNLLALNAGVEAARAGEAGRGFAVVAQEVRALAQRSTEAAKSIKELINTSSGQVENGVSLVTRSGQSLDEIVQEVATMAEVIASIASSANEQAIRLREVSGAAEQMDKFTQQNAAMVEEATAAAKTLSDETEDLADLVSRFRTEGTASAAPMRQTTTAKAKPRVASAAPTLVTADTSAQLPETSNNSVHAMQRELSKRTASPQRGSSARAGAQSASAAAFDESDWEEF